jgi:hypothetical protein
MCRPEKGRPGGGAGLKPAEFIAYFDADSMRKSQANN